MVSNNVSTAFSFEGWNVKELLLGNKEFIKSAIALVVLFTAGFDPVVNIIVAGLAKIVLDVIDFWASEVQLK